jgi:hypothetical protein
MVRIEREAIEIRLHPENFNRDDGFNLSYSWRHILKTFQTSNRATMANTGQVQLGKQPRPLDQR